MSGVSDPHDRFFRFVFSDPTQAAGELRMLLPPAVASRIDWTALTPMKTDFVKAVLDELRSDVLFTAAVDGQPLFIYLLFEHQSTVDGLMPLRLLGYMTQIWEQYVREQKSATHKAPTRLPAIVPLVLHHSDKGWRSTLRFEDLVDLDGELEAALLPHIPRFGFIIDDLSLAREEELKNRAVTQLGRLALLCLKRARESPDFVAELARWSDLIVQTAAMNGVQALVAVMRYILEVNAAAPQRVEKLVRQLGPVVEEAYMTGAQILRAEGEAKGEAKGRAATLLTLLGSKFGAVPPPVAERLRHATIEQLDGWTRRVLDAARLEDVFGAP